MTENITQTEPRNLLQSLNALERFHDQVLKSLGQFRVEALKVADAASRAAAEPSPATFLALKAANERMDELEHELRDVKKKK